MNNTPERDDMTADTPAIRAKNGPFLSEPGRARYWMNWLFAKKSRMFWVLQIAGWTGFFLLHVSSVSTFVAGRTPQALLYSLASSLVGFLTTSILARPIYQFARRQRPIWLIAIALPATIVMATAMAAMKVQIFTQMFGDDWLDVRNMPFGLGSQLLLLLPDIQVNLFLLGSWAGFYFGINYYLNLRNEMERAVLSARLADQAQLKMLRYQLNPHFLFNTLNAISTLVLYEDSKQANRMITQLSAFLRYSLDSDPLQLTTLEEEIRALKLYLDIEKTRFEDRLSIVFDVSAECESAKVPSLILQPAVENSIKYAIAQMEAGGQIQVWARRRNDRLEMRVCDNGPSAPDDPMAILQSASAGVGLVNMRDRLAYLYQDDCDFKLERIQPDGLCVTVSIPFQHH